MPTQCMWARCTASIYCWQQGCTRFAVPKSCWSQTIEVPKLWLELQPNFGSPSWQWHISETDKQTWIQLAARMSYQLKQSIGQAKLHQRGESNLGVSFSIGFVWWHTVCTTDEFSHGECRLHADVCQNANSNKTFCIQWDIQCDMLVLTTQMQHINNDAGCRCNSRLTAQALGLVRGQAARWHCSTFIR